MTRRVVDVIFSGTSLIILSPLMLLIAIGIVFTNGFPVIYSQTRVGRKGRLYTLRKFRTMLRHSEPYGPELSRNNDPRVTKFGRRLRRFHLDELPQLWNVLKGNMTIVGYRPERPFFVAKILKLNPGYGELIEKEKPGLVSSGVIEFGYASNIESLVERAHIDIEYLNHRTYKSDMNLIWKTAGHIIRGKGL